MILHHMNFQNLPGNMFYAVDIIVLSYYVIFTSTCVNMYYQGGVIPMKFSIY